jgi:cob(I)alamin adenosyltransferase
LKDVRKTHLLDRSLVDKDSEIIKCLGTIDEANSFIGLARVFARDRKVKDVLKEVQKKMFKAGLELVSNESMSRRDCEELEAFVNEFEGIVSKPSKFIFLEKNQSSAFLSVARAIVRRAERKAVSLQKKGKASIWLVEWLNRLSYLLYLMVLMEIEDYEEVRF